MGQANQRGSYEQRKSLAVAKQETEAKNHPPMPNVRINGNYAQVVAMAQVFGWDATKYIKGL